MALDDGVWFITGCSTGFGRVLAELTVAKGWRLVATARNSSSLTDLAVGREDRVLLADLDVTKPKQVAAAVAAAQEQFGVIDVLVNNAGYGYQSTAEEGEDGEIRALFDTNVFGLFDLTRAVLPSMRQRRQGHIINITSISGLIGGPGSGYYAASKHAVEGFSDALRAEVAPLGIQVTCVEPGPFRTDFAGRSLRQKRTQIADYDATAGQRQDSIRSRSGSQQGDPRKAGEAMIAITQMAEAPRHLPLGKIAFEAFANDRTKRLADSEAVRDLCFSADYPEK